MQLVRVLVLLGTSTHRGVLLHVHISFLFIYYYYQ